MANRPAWSIYEDFVISKSFDFEWNGGFAVSQKRKNIVNLHKEIKEKTNGKALEISTKSEVLFGQKLSAFNLKLEGHILENVFQSSKVYEKGGPYLDLLEVEPRESKRDERHLTSGVLKAFEYKGQIWELEPKTMFYDYIYLVSVFETFDDSELKELLDYDWFTDIEFNPKKSINCQARTVAILKYILDTNNKEVLESYEKWAEFHKKVVKA